jgi:DNA-binding MarR family transcriptional regulator
MDDARRVQAAFPKIYLACHVRHARSRDAVGISDRDANLLGHLDPTRAISPTTLARHLGVTPSTLSAQLAELVAAGLVGTGRCPQDRRKLDVTLTSKGARAMQAASVLDTTRLTAVLPRLEEAERAVAVHGLELLAAASLEAVTERSAARAWVLRRGRRGRRRT